VLTYRWLDNNAHDQEVLKQIGQTIHDLNWVPLPSAGMLNAAFKILCAFDGEALVGWHVIQFFTHSEPMYVHEAYRGTRCAHQLAEQIFDYLVTSNCRGFMIVAESPVAQRLAEAYGMKRVEVPVYVWLG
jgi:hypothetical protein